jgi:hypothetical protein
MTRFRFVAVLAAFAALAFASTTSAASPVGGPCPFSYWTVRAQSLTVRPYAGGPVIDTLHYGDTWFGPLGQHDAGWVYGAGIKRGAVDHVSRTGYVLHQYLDYEGSLDC